MRRLIGLAALAGVMAFCEAYAAQNPGFKGIYIGQPEAELPKTLIMKSSFYEGIHEGVYFRILVSDKQGVYHFSVIYHGETFDRSAISKPITLAQAMQEHSVGRTTKPKLAFARGRDGKVFGLVDLSVAIAYETADPTNPNSYVERVNYMKSDAPLLNVRSEDILDEPSQKSLLQGASDKGQKVGDVVVIPSEKRFAFSTRDKALAALTEQSDKVVGRGKRTLALMSQAETWLAVDEKHSEAKETFHQLRQFYRDFRDDFDILRRMYEANRAKLKDQDLDVVAEPHDLNEKIKRKLTQLKAMGFREY